MNQLPLGEGSDLGHHDRLDFLDEVTCYHNQHPDRIDELGKIPQEFGRNER